MVVTRFLTNSSRLSIKVTKSGHTGLYFSKVDGDATVEAAAAEDEFDYDFLFEAPPNSGHPSWITEVYK